MVGFAKKLFDRSWMERICSDLEVMNGRDQWKLEVGYNMRWKVECTFSDLKRLFGDVLRARTRLTDMAEVFQKVSVLNIYKGIRESVKAHV